MWNVPHVNVMPNGRMDDLNGGLYNGLPHRIDVSPHSALDFPINPWINICMFVNKNSTNEVYLEIDGILPKGPYPPCLRMADRALLAGYPRIQCNDRARYVSYTMYCYMFRATGSSPFSWSLIHVVDKRKRLAYNQIMNRLSIPWKWWFIEDKCSRYFLVYAL